MLTQTKQFYKEFCIDDSHSEVEILQLTKPVTKHKDIYKHLSITSGVKILQLTKHKVIYKHLSITSGVEVLQLIKLDTKNKVIYKHLSINSGIEVFQLTKPVTKHQRLQTSIQNKTMS